MDANTEVTDVNKADRDFPPDQVGKLEPLPAGEVGGRALLVRYRRCSLCGFIGLTPDIRLPAQQCSSCGTLLAGS